LKKIFFLPCLWITFSASSQQSWHQELRYRIDVALNVNDNSLQGFLRLEYINHSPDTLYFIWFRLWPNAFRNDQTQYSEELLEQGRTDFYFSDKNQKGYINQLNFRIDGALALTLDHPQFQDLLKIMLPKPLLPGDSALITTSFHEKLPYNFSGTGYLHHAYQLTNWYPEPAVFDKEGWHPEPFVEQSPAGHELSDFDIRISLPKKYVVAASGTRRDPVEIPPDSSQSLHFELRQGRSFAWIADRRFKKETDSTGVPAAIYYLKTDSSYRKKMWRIARATPSSGLAETETSYIDTAVYGGLSFISSRQLKYDSSKNHKHLPLPLFTVSKGSGVRIAPAVGYNRYDQVMIGGLISNATYPDRPFQFLALPMYGINSGRFDGLGRISYSWQPQNSFQKITAGVNGSVFSTGAATDSNGQKLFSRFCKIVPYLRFDLRKSAARRHLERWIDLRSYLIGEKDFDHYAFSVSDSLIHPNAYQNNFRYLNQLSFNLRDQRVLYPYDASLEIQQTSLFYRINLNAHYFFNYPKGGGVSVRFFGAKFGAWNQHGTVDLSRYEPKLLGVTGNEDYTYDNYFLGRTASTAIEDASVSNGGIAAQQIMIRDGGLKLRLDQYDYIQGRSGNWVLAMNFNTTLPEKIMPVKIPLKIFFDFGTYAEAWQNNPLTSRFLYTGGLQLSLFRNVLNIYAPLIYSSDFNDLLKSVSFGKRITFSIDFQNLDPRKMMKFIADHE
jgi:hypothetical protein